MLQEAKLIIMWKKNPIKIKFFFICFKHQARFFDAEI